MSMELQELLLRPLNLEPILPSWTLRADGLKLAHHFAGN